VIFKTLELEDFGIYAGRQMLDLEPERKRPVVLVGGTNGAGKTTLLEAFTICLHGRRALGPRVSRDRYDAHIRSRFHVPPNGSAAEECAVTLGFEHVQSGRGSEYVVSRRWRRTEKGRIHERLRITSDGTEVDDLSDASRQDFLDSLLPPGLAGFFLFDGEQIQALADDENGEQLADAVKRLLGLDLLGQLQADLKRFVGKTVRKGGGDEVGRQLQEAEAAMAEARSTIAVLGEEKEALLDRQAKLDARVVRAQDRLAREGGALAAERAKIEKGAGRAATEISVAEEELRGLIAGLLPFAISQRLADSVEQRLEVEQAAEEDEVVARRIKAAARRLGRSLKTESGESVAKTLRELLGVEEHSKEPRLHAVSAAERAVMLSQLRIVRDGVRADAVRIAKRLRRARDRGDRAQRQLEQVPADEALAPLIEEVQEAERSRGSLEGEIGRLDGERQQADYELSSAERDLAKAEEEVKKRSKGLRSAELAQRTVALLEEYEDRAELRRLDQIELDAARYFNRLSRKGELLSKVTIDRETFRVQVLRWDGTELPKERLSAGEKQLLAIAILWALARASQRPLPVVVDTPLARLDREHRKRLLEEYLPHVSHQVVVLSTDTEVDLAAASELKSVTARRIFLSHDVETASTSVEEGYFSPTREAALGAG